MSANEQFRRLDPAQAGRLAESVQSTEPAMYWPKETDLIAFIRARLADDERIARATVPKGMRVDDTTAAWSVSEFKWALGGPDHFSFPDDDDIEHAVRQDPARALREVDAKRLLLRLVLDLRAAYQDDPCNGARQSDNATASHILGILALPYADHSEYRQEWRPIGH